jgi:AraC-like DNA-binding protein
VDETGHDIPLRAGSVIVTTPSIGHRYGPLPKGRWVERFVVFDGPMFTTWEMLGLFHTASPVIHTDDIETWDRALDTVAGSANTSHSASMLERICSLQLMLARLLWPRTSPLLPEESEHTTWIAAACALLDAFDDHTGPRYGTAEIADRLSMSADGFRKRFKRLTGTPPERYRSHKRIERSQYLIQQRHDITNRELADRLGYCDEHHFSRAFKQITGTSPLAFRRSLPSPSAMLPDQY